MFYCYQILFRFSKNMFTGTSYRESIGQKTPLSVIRVNKNSFSYAQYARTVAHEIGHL